MPTAICFGELIVDMVSDETDASLHHARRFLKLPGGAPANVAAGLSRLGTPSRFVGQVGQDPLGDWLQETLEQEHVDMKYLRRSPSARTTMALIATRSDGKKDLCFYRHPGADAEFAPQDLDPTMFEDAQLFHCGGVSLSLSPCRYTQLEAARQARSHGLLISFDPNWRPSLWEDHGCARRILWDMMCLADIVKVADEEWEFLTGTPNLHAGAKEIRDAGVRLVVVTLGDRGAFYSCEAAEGFVEGFPARVVDTLGAGDAFMSGLLHQTLAYRSLDELLKPSTLQHAVRFANACGALTTQNAGAIPALPQPDDVSALIQTIGLPTNQRELTSG